MSVTTMSEATASIADVSRTDATKRDAERKRKKSGRTHRVEGDLRAARVLPAETRSLCLMCVCYPVSEPVVLTCQCSSPSIGCGRSFLIITAIGYKSRQWRSYKSEHVGHI